MMPDLFSIGPLTVHWYGVMMALGFLAGLLNWTLLGKPIGRDLKFCSDLLFWIMIAGIVGARTAYVLSDISYFLANPDRILRIDEGGLIYSAGSWAPGWRSSSLPAPTAHPSLNWLIWW